MKRINYWSSLLSVSTFFLILLPVYGQNPIFPTEVEKAKKAIVRIQIFDESLDRKSNVTLGSGFVLEKKNIIATNFHVVTRLADPGRIIVITTRSGKKLSFKRILKLLGQMDMAFLEVEGYEGPVLKPADTSPAFLDTAYTMGFLDGKFSKQIEKNFQKKGILCSMNTFHFTEKPVGISGSPILDAQGKVIGILNMGGEHNLKGFPVDHLKELLKQPDLPSLKTEHLIKQEMTHLLKLAAQGDAQSQYILSLPAWNQIIKEADLEHIVLEKKAFKWALKAADQGHSSAQALLGYYFANGEGGSPRDLPSALKWLELAARQGDTPAMYNLGLLLYKKKDPESQEKAFELFLQSARQDYHSQAKLHLGTMLLKGEGVEQNLKEAFKWFQEAANQGNLESQVIVGLMLFDGEGVRKDYGQALKWLLQAAEQGHSKASQLVTMMLNEGLGIAQNQAKVTEWQLQNQAQEGSPKDKYEMGLKFHEGINVEKNEAKAFEWFYKAAMEQYAPAQLHVSLMFMEGVGVAQDEIMGSAVLSFAVKNLENPEYDMKTRKHIRQMLETFLKKHPHLLNAFKNMRINLPSFQCEENF